jgi:hypothetical protein
MHLIESIQLGEQVEEKQKKRRVSSSFPLAASSLFLGGWANTKNRLEPHGSA